SAARLKQRVRQITRRNRGVPLARVIAELNAYLSGWVTYFRRPLPDPAAPPRGLDPAQVALFPPQAVQASPSAGGLPAKSWGTGMASLASRPQRQGLLAQSPKLPSQRGHDHRLVPRPGPDPPGRPSPCVTNFRKPPWYVERMPGGVGGGN